MPQIRQRTVLFADLRGSTSLYETLGNAAATGVVTRTVAELGRIVGDEQGRVVKTLGDGLMALFESPRQAVAAAEEMHDALHHMSPVGSSPRAPVLKLKVGVAHGEV